SPRQLDRNITLVGRVIRGMELLSAVPRGPEPLGMLEDPARHAPIRAITLASELPAEQREPIEGLRTDTATFDAYVDSRRNPRDPFYDRPAAHVAPSNTALPSRPPPPGPPPSSRRAGRGRPRLPWTFPQPEDTMALLRMRIAGNDDQVRAIANLLQSL